MKEGLRSQPHFMSGLCHCAGGLVDPKTSLVVTGPGSQVSQGQQLSRFNGSTACLAASVKRTY